MKKKKSRKKLLIGAGVLIVVAVGGVSAFGKMSSGEAVSYTHLDVYKRHE